MPWPLDGQATSAPSERLDLNHISLGPVLCSFYLKCRRSFAHRLGLIESSLAHVLVSPGEAYEAQTCESDFSLHLTAPTHPIPSGPRRYRRPARLSLGPDYHFYADITTFALQLPLTAIKTRTSSKLITSTSVSPPPAKLAPFTLPHTPPHHHARHLPGRRL